MAKKKLNEKSFAQDYGFALSFLKSSPELYSLFKKAVSGTWAADKFVAQVKNTKWYKQHGEQYRTNLALQKTDPATWRAKYNGAVADVRDKAKGMGVTLSAGQLKTVTNNYLSLGYNDGQLSDLLSHYVRFSSATGKAGSDIQAMQQTAYRNGMKFNAHTYQAYAQAIARGDLTLEDFNKKTRQHAQSLAPGFADQLKAGMDLADVASPYVQSMAGLLEKNPADIDLFTPEIRKALSYKGEDGKMTSMSLTDFEQSVRNTPAWQKTKQAQNQTMAVAHQVLSDFGFSS